ncbi:MAG: LamG domain-containing protein [PVC group bacterium]|nr:LamG domain-containing protein [PVC group bacterium]
MINLIQPIGQPLNNTTCKVNIRGIADTNDKSPGAHTVTNNGVTVTSPQFLGFNSMQFAAASTDNLSIASHADFNFGLNPFTIAGRFYFTAATSSRILIGKGQDANNRYYLGWSGANVLNWQSVVSGASQSVVTSSFTPTLNTAYYIAIVREHTGTNGAYLFVNGTKLGTGTDNNNITNTGAVTVGTGMGGGGTLTSYFDGSAQAIQIMKNRAVWTRDFTPPSHIY